MTPYKYKNITLLAGSLVFYASGEPVGIVLLLASVAMNYIFGLFLGAGKRRVVYLEHKGREKTEIDNCISKYRRLFFAAILLNVAFLLWFKMSIGGRWLPLGISFYTFQMISYLIDVWRGDVERELSVWKFASYVVMFPQLVMGPIVEYGQVKSALSNREFNACGIQDGLKVFTAGLVAKVLLADRIGMLWQEVQVIGFESISTPLAWLGAVAYSMMLYFDFFGYSLMAIGLGRMLGFELPVNFDSPYAATSVREFYRRWHMTLGRWFCKYVYIPLGGNRKGRLRTLLNLLVVWVLTAVWHGTTGNFLIWGLALWFFIALERVGEGLGLQKLFDNVPGRILSHGYLLFVIPLTWMCFAISDCRELGIYLGRMFDLVPGVSVKALDWKNALEDYWWLLLAGIIGATPFITKVFRKLKDSALGSILLVVLFWVCVWRVQAEGQNPFMYFDF